MNCFNCQNQNEKNALFCKECGTNLYSPQKGIISNTFETSVEKSNPDKSNVFLIVSVGIMLAANISIRIIQATVSDWWMLGIWRYIIDCLWLLQSAIWVLPALAIRNKNLKIIGFILCLVVAIWQIYEYIMLVRG